ncbi:hypothetical protein JOC24_000965 [Streptomyces sp. HB132]|nr:hypothetical protein [Streptomyces sp. HB132]
MAPGRGPRTVSGRKAREPSAGRARRTGGLTARPRPGAPLGSDAVLMAEGRSNAFVA